MFTLKILFLSYISARIVKVCNIKINVLFLISFLFITIPLITYGATYSTGIVQTSELNQNYELKVECLNENDESLSSYMSGKGEVPCSPSAKKIKFSDANFSLSLCPECEREPVAALYIEERDFQMYPLDQSETGCASDEVYYLRVTVDRDSAEFFQVDITNEDGTNEPLNLNVYTNYRVTPGCGFKNFAGEGNEIFEGDVAGDEDDEEVELVLYDDGTASIDEDTGPENIDESQQQVETNPNMSLGGLELTSKFEEKDISVVSHTSVGTKNPNRPVAVISRKDIELSGMTNLYDLLITRAHYNYFGMHRTLVLGSSYTTFLMDGRRLPDPNSNHIFNSGYVLKFLPLVAVDRIEILSGSATVLHGGQAVSGAVNIVLREEFEGLEIQLDLQRPTSAGANAEQGSMVWRGKVAEGHMMVAAETSQQEEIASADRKFSRAGWAEGGSFANTTGVSIGGNTVFIPTKSYDSQGQTTATHIPDAEGATVARLLGDCSKEDGYTGPLANPSGVPGIGCGFPYANTAWEVDRSERQSVFLSFDHPVGEDTEAYLGARIAQGKTAFRYAPSVGTFSFTPSSDVIDELTADPEINSLPDSLIIAHRFVGHGPRNWRSNLDEYDLTLGLRGKFQNNIGYDAHMRNYRYRDEENGDTFVSRRIVQDILKNPSADMAYDFSNPQSTDPAHLAAIRTSALQLDRQQGIEHRTARLTLNGETFTLPGGNTGWAVSTEIDNEEQYNKNRYSSMYGGDYEVFDSSDVLGSGGINFEGERQRISTMGELFLLPLKDWQVGLGTRYDDYDDVGGATSFQVSSAYQLNSVVSLRGAWGRGSRPPSLSSLHNSESLTHPYICDVQTYSGPLENCNHVQVRQLSGGNPELEPDEAKVLSFGGEVDLGFLALSSDWFGIQVKNTEAQMSTQNLIDMEAADKPLPAGVVIHRQGGNGSITQIDNPLVNTGETNASGIDTQVHMQWETVLADFFGNLRWLYMLDNEVRVDGDAQPGDFSKNRVHASIHAKRDNLTLGWSTYAVSSFDSPSSGHYDSWVGHDITFYLDEPFGLKGTKLSGGVFNVTDEEPSVNSVNPNDYSGDLDTQRGRTFFMGYKMIW